MKKNIICANLLFMGLGWGMAANAAHYTIVVDAGSSGSRVHLFQVEETKTVPLIKEIFTEAIQPGISSFENNPQSAPASLKKLWDDTRQQLIANNSDPKEASVIVYGTAGMRLLSKKHQHAIYDAIKNDLNVNYPFSVQSIKTLTGEMEGIDGWLSVNYLKGNFQQQKPTLGIIDMGGASTQIAFNARGASSYNYTDFVINGVSYHVFSVSFLGLGLDTLRRELMASAASCYPTGDAFDSAHPDKRGVYNFNNCQSLIAEYVDKKIARGSIPYHDDQSFVAMAGIYYAYHFFGADTIPDQAVLEQSLATICDMNWDTLCSMNSGKLKGGRPGVPANFLSAYCANGVYIDYLLYGIYHLKGASQLSIENSDWTLGAVLFDEVKKAATAS